MYSIVLLVLMFALLYFFMIRPENKRKKQAQAMRDSLTVGDEITTIGGIIGTICAVKENTIVIETGADRVRIEFTKWAVSNVGVQTGEQPSKDSKDSKKKEKEEKLEIFIPNGPRLGNKVIEAKHVAKAFGDKLLFDDLNFMLPPNGIVGIIGPNGAGKTTLFRLIMGLEKADKGEFEVGETVKVAYVDQQHKDIDPNKSVYQVISGGNDLIRMGGRDINARAYLSRFNFSGADQEKLCGVLSGGERNRLHLALCLKEEGNVLLLDEPTNDIDVNTLRALEEGLEDFAGCAVVISHDRWFLDRICTHILAFEGDSNVFFFEGSYSEYEENKQKRLGKEEPTRVRYRKLMND